MAATSGSKLNAQQKRQLCQWLCDGLRNSEINERLQAATGHTLTTNQLWLYRVKYADEIAEAERRALAAAVTHGYAKRSRRIQGLQDHVHRLEEALLNTPSEDWGNLPDQYLRAVAELRKELGQEAPVRFEHGSDPTRPFRIAGGDDAACGGDRAMAALSVLASLGVLVIGEAGAAAAGDAGGNGNGNGHEAVVPPSALS